jgi:hypothetical protein
MDIYLTRKFNSFLFTSNKQSRNGVGVELSFTMATKLYIPRHKFNQNYKYKTLIKIIKEARH